MMYGSDKINTEDISMAKTIKFNLICDGKPIRTVEDLKNNFSIEDVLEYYQNGLLKRWLTVRGYESELEEVEKISATDAIEIVSALSKIFDVEKDADKIAEDTYIFEYSRKYAEKLEALEQQKIKKKDMIMQYHKGYWDLIETILNNNDDMPRIKAAIAETDKNYFELFELDYRRLFWTCLSDAPLAIFAMLMNENMRDYYIISDDDKDERGNVLEEKYDKLEMYKGITDMIKSVGDLQIKLGENLKVFAGETDAYWKDLEPKGKKCMILRLSIQDFVRAAGISGGDKSAEEVNGKFLIFDGIDYKSINARHQLLYMEV